MPQIAGKEVGQGDNAIGFGMMGLTWRPVPTPYPEAFKTLRAALTTGSNFWNGGQLYGPSHANSLHLLNGYFSAYPDEADKVVISIKSIVDPKTHKPDGSPESVRRNMDECLRVLDGKKFLDVFECARVDPETPIEDTIEILVEYVKDGKLGGIGLSECGPNTIRRAAKVHKIAAVEVEFSMFSTEILENGVAEACSECGIPIVAYSPLGRGFLTGQFKTIDDLPDMLRRFPRYQPGAFEQNLKLVEEVEKVAKAKGCSVGQVAIAWVNTHSGLNGGPIIIPIPGATTEERVRENTKYVKLSEEEFEQLNGIVKTCTVVGERTPAMFSQLSFGETPERK